MNSTEEGRMTPTGLKGLLEAEAATEGQQKPPRFPDLVTMPLQEEVALESPVKGKMEGEPIAPPASDKGPISHRGERVEVAKPRTLENVVGDFRNESVERLAGLLLSPEAQERERTELKEFITQKEEIDGVFRRTRGIAGSINEVGKAIEEAEAFAPTTERGIRLHGKEIRGLREEKKELERELERVREKEKEWIGDAKRREKTQRAYEGWQSLIEDEEEKLRRKDEERAREYEEQKQQMDEFTQRLETWQDYLGNEEEIRGREGEYENKIRVLTQELEGSPTEEERTHYTKRIAVWQGQLTRQRRRIPQDVKGFEGKPKSETERLYREAVEEMRRIKEGKVKEVEKVKKVEGGDKRRRITVEDARRFVGEMLVDSTEFDSVSLTDNLLVIASEGELGEEDKSLIEKVRTQLAPEGINRILKELKTRLSYFLKTPKMEEREKKVLTCVRVLEQFPVKDEKANQLWQQIKTGIKTALQEV